MHCVDEKSRQSSRKILKIDCRTSTFGTTLVFYDSKNVTTRIYWLIVNIVKICFDFFEF